MLPKTRLSLRPEVSQRSPAPDDPPLDPDGLLRLVRQIAKKDRIAFADLYKAVSAQLYNEIRSTIPDPVRANAITSATFVEVWSLARFHTSPDTDVLTWMSTIAARRAADWRSCDDGDHCEDATPKRTALARRQLWLTAVANSYDCQTNLALAALLNRPPTDRT